jgi:DNA repair protein RecO (recombination protein O)
LTFFPGRGFILQTRPYSEADKIAQLYTPQMGRIKAVVKGVRKPKSRMASSIEFFTESSFMLHKKAGGDLYLMSQAKVLDDYHDLKQDFANITILQILADVLIHTLPDHEPHSETYAFLKQFLEALRLHVELREQVLAAFLIRLLDLSGFPMELSVCAECGTSLEKKKAALIPHRGGALCGDCAPTAPARLKVSPSGLAVLRQMKKLPMEKIHVLKLGASVSRQLFQTILDYLEHTIEKRLKTVDYYRKTLGNT